MNSEVWDFVMDHPLFSSHDHHLDFNNFEGYRSVYEAKSLLGIGYATADLLTASGVEFDDQASEEEQLADHWRHIQTTGYGRSVNLGSKALFGLEFSPENFGKITKKLRILLKDRSASEIYDYFVREKANNKWVLQDLHFRPGNEDLLQSKMFPDYYRFSWRITSW